MYITCNLQTLERETDGTQRAVGKVLNEVDAKLVGDDRSAFDQLVYSLVRTQQLVCARMLDKDLAEEYDQELMRNNYQYGQQLIYH